MLTGKVVAVERRFGRIFSQCVVTDSTDDYLITMHMTGSCLIQTDTDGNSKIADVGDQVELDYVNGQSYGLWFGRVIV